MSRWSERRLLARVLSGDGQACVELIERYHAPICRLLARLCVDTHLAEDLTQETFAAFWANIETFHGDSSLGTWLHRIAYRKFVDGRRRGARRAARAAEGGLDEALSALPGPDEQALVREQSRQLHQALERLNPRERDAIVLHYLQGLTYRDMAKVLDEPTGTLKWRTGHALENLRRLLEEERSDERETNTARISARAQ